MLLLEKKGLVFQVIAKRVTQVPMWPDWAIFEIFLATSFRVKVAQLFGNILGNFEKQHF